MLFTGGPYYVAAGGAPIYLGSCSIGIDCSKAFSIEKWTIQILDHLNAAPTDGTVLFTGGPYYVVAGGAPIYLGNCTIGIDCSKAVRVDPTGLTSSLSKINLAPQDGTVLRAYPNYYVVAGGAPIYLGSCSIGIDCSRAVNVDPTGLTSSLSGINELPKDGTVLEGMPGEQYWIFTSGCLQGTSVTASAIRVDGNAVTQLPQCAASTANG